MPVHSSRKLDHSISNYLKSVLDSQATPGILRWANDLLLACFGCLIGEKLDNDSPGMLGANIDIEKDSRPTRHVEIWSCVLWF